MKKIITLLFILLVTYSYPYKSFSNIISIHTSVEDTLLNLMPVPAQVTPGQGKFRLNTAFNIGIKGDFNDRLYAAASRIVRRLDGRTGLFISQGVITPDTNPQDAFMMIGVEREGEVRLHEDENYTLTITNANIVLEATTDIGALRGLETFLQLLRVDDEGYFFPAITIRDQPRFPWRGLLIDVSRHFMPIAVLKRNLDGLAAMKINVFHWHLTEDQGFRIESKTFPKLHQMASDGNYYTHEQVRDIISYADERGIRVVPEFDIPGHATSWLVAYPELGSAPGPYTLERKFGIFDPTIDPTREETYEFFDAFFQEMTALFPDEYVHIGGDENEGHHWDANPDIQEFMKKNDIPDNHALQSYFNNRILEILTKYGKKMVGWDEIYQPGISKDIVIQSWRGKEALFSAARNGYQTILSNGYYIDLMHPAESHYLNDPLPPDNNLTEEEQQNILGGEATMWSEHVTPETVDSRIWPRTAAIAERLWSPASVTNVEDMYRRLEIISLQLEELGLTHLKNREMMMRRLANGYNISAIKVLSGVIEPLKGYARNEGGEIYTVFSPYTLIADVATADAKDARRFRNLLENFMKTPDEDTSEKLIYWLELWKNNHENIKKTIERSPAIEEIKILSYNLSQLSRVGLEALEYWEKNEKPASSWVKESKEVIEKAKEPGGKTEIMVVGAVEKLVDLVSK